jgi:hypothetical protein
MRGIEMKTQIIASAEETIELASKLNNWVNRSCVTQGIGNTTGELIIAAVKLLRKCDDKKFLELTAKNFRESLLK